MNGSPGGLANPALGSYQRATLAVEVADER